MTSFYESVTIKENNTFWEGIKMERHTQELSLLVKQIQLLEEQQQRQNYFNNLFSQDPNPYNKSFEEIIEYLLGTSESNFLVH